MNRPRLNPFAFPSDTDFRFVLLVVAVLGTSLFIYNLLYFDFPANSERIINTYSACQDMYQSTAPTDFFAANAASAAFGQCTAAVDRTQAAWAIGGLAVLLIVTGVIYWTYPARKIRRDQLVPLSAEDAPEVVATLADLCREVGLSRPPVFLWNPLNPAISGQAFGRFGRYYVALTGGLVTQFYTDPPAFRAIVLHELAHLRNADVDKTYLTVAVWQAFAVAALVPLAVSLLLALVRAPSTDQPSFIFNLSWRALALSALVYLTRNAVLRAREMYADVRASVWDGPAGGLRRVLAALPHPAGRRWRATLRVHPDPLKRRRALDEPHRLFRLGFRDALVTGIAATIAIPTVKALLALLIPPSALWEVGAALIFAPLAVGVVGSSAWRASFAALVRGTVPRGAGRLGLGLGLGLILGQTLSFSSVIGELPGQPLTPISLVTTLIFNVLWSILLLISLFFFLRWIAAGASTWLEVVATGRSPRPPYVAGLTIASALLSAWLGLLFIFQNISVTTLGFSSGFAEVLAALLFVPIALQYILLQPLTVLALISLWAFPLAAWFWRARVVPDAGSSWAFLGSSSRRLTLPPRAPLRPGLALSIGLGSGLVFCVLLLVVRVGVRLGLSEATWNGDQFKLAFFYGEMILAGLVQAGGAAVVAGWVRRLGALHGLFAAFVGGCVMTVGVLGLNLLFGGSLEATFAWTSFSLVVNGGALLALPVSLSVSALAGWIRR